MSSGPQSNKVTLIHCGLKGGYIHIPMSILSLAESLVRRQFEVRLVDLRIMDLTPEDLEGTLFAGISHMTGNQQIPPALQAARMAKQHGVPVVFGGTHPTILPEQTAAHPLVDVAVRGEGEEAVVDIARYFQGQGQLSDIPGIAFKDESGRVVYTGRREPPPFDRYAPLPYHLLPMDQYSATREDFSVQSSRGCPHRCAFCAEISLFKSRWRAKPADVVVQEIERLLQQFDPQRIWFMDSNFFCNRKRVQEFCERIIDKNIRMEFFGECRYDYFVKYDRSFLQLIKRAGFREIEFGGESGSNRTLAFIKKDITREMILEGVTKCRTEGLRSFTSFMVGFPGETEETREETLDLIDRIQTIDPLGSKVNGLFVFTPFPGTELFDLVVEQHGFVPPDSLEAWGEYDLYNSRNITWFGEKTKRRLQTMSTIQRYFFTFKTLRRWGWKESIRRHRGLGKAMLSLAFNASLYPLARIRWRRRFFDLGFEWRLWHWVFLRFMGRK